MTKEPINTNVLESFIKSVKLADNQKQKEIRLETQHAKNIVFALSLVLARLHCNLEEVINKKENPNEDVISINIDAGKNW